MIFRFEITEAHATEDVSICLIIGWLREGSVQVSDKIIVRYEDPVRNMRPGVKLLGPIRGQMHCRVVGIEVHQKTADYAHAEEIHEQIGLTVSGIDSAEVIIGSIATGVLKASRRVHARPYFPDGWHDLPCGGSVKMKNGLPIQLCDKGHSSLEESKILAEAEKYTDLTLYLAGPGRALRWRQDGLIRLLFDLLIDPNAPNRQFWSYAQIMLDVCARCGFNAVVQWIDYPYYPYRECVCKKCALDGPEEDEPEEDEP